MELFFNVGVVFLFQRKKKKRGYNHSNPWREEERRGGEETEVAGYFFAFTLCIA
jgi:hypothetical protein